MVTGAQIPGLPPPPGSAYQMVPGGRELRPPVAGRPVDGEAEELVGAAVVEPAHHPTGDDGAGLGVVGEHLDGKLLVDDLADLLPGAVGQSDPGVIGEAAVDDPDLLPELVDED